MYLGQFEPQIKGMDFSGGLSLQQHGHLSIGIQIHQAWLSLATDAHWSRSDAGNLLI